MRDCIDFNWIWNLQQALVHWIIAVVEVGVYLPLMKDLKLPKPRPQWHSQDKSYCLSLTLFLCQLLKTGRTTNKGVLLFSIPLI